MWAKCLSTSAMTATEITYSATWSAGGRILIDTIIPFFGSHPLRTSKQRNFEKFATCVELVEKGHHLSFEGLAGLAEIAETMNRQKPRTELIGILRGHTPNIRDTG